MNGHHGFGKGTVRNREDKEYRMMNAESGVKGMGDGPSLERPHREGSRTEGPDVGEERSGHTGDARVDSILTLLHDLDDKPVVDHAELYLEVHAQLGRELNPAGAPRGSGAHGTA